MLKIIIVEDEPNEAKTLTSYLNDVANESDTKFEITYFQNGIEFLDQYSHNYDLIFLDINMPLIDGITLAKEIRKIDSKVAIVFVSRFANYALEGYEVDALDFIVKPLNYEKFAIKMHRILSKISIMDDERLIIKTREEEIGLPVSKIKFFEVQGHYVTFHCLDGVYTEYITLKQIQNKLTREKGFIQCSRSFIVNTRYIDMLKGDLILVGKESIPISRTFKKDVYNFYVRFVPKDR